MGFFYGIEVAGEMEVNIFHWQYLGIASSCSASFDSEYRSQRGFAQYYRCFFTNPVQTFAQADRNGCFSFAGWSG